MDSLERRIQKSAPSGAKKEFIEAFRRVRAEYSDIRTLEDDETIELIVKNVPLNLIEDAFALYAMSFHKRMKKESDEGEVVSTRDSVEHIVRAAKSIGSDGLSSMRVYADRFARQTLKGDKFLPHTFIRHYTSAFSSTGEKQKGLLFSAVNSLIELPWTDDLLTQHPLLNLMYHWGNVIGMNEGLPLWVELLCEKAKAGEELSTYVKLGYTLACERDKQRVVEALREFKKMPRLLSAPLVSARYLCGGERDDFLGFVGKVNRHDMAAWEALFESNGNREVRDEAFGERLYKISRAKALKESDIGLSAVKQVAGDLAFKVPQILENIVDIVSSGKATEEGLRLAKKHRDKNDFRQIAVLFSKLAKMKLSDEHRAAWVAAFDALYNERRAVWGPKADTAEYEAKDNALLEKISKISPSRMDAATKAISAIVKKINGREGSLENILGDTAVASASNKVAEAIVDDVCKTRANYTGMVLAAAPIISQRINQAQWKRAWRAVQHLVDSKVEQKGAVLKSVKDPKRAGNKFAFVKGLCAALESVDDVDSFLDELPKKSTTDIAGHAVIVEASHEFERSVGWRALRVLNSHARDSGHPIEYLRKAYRSAAEALDKVKSSDRERIVSGLERILEKFKGEDGFDRLEIAGEFIVAGKRSIELYAERFDDWVGTGVEHAKSKDEIIRFLRDEENYFTSRMESLVEGLRLGEVSQRLLTYVQALTGCGIEIKASDDDSLSCRLEGNAFYLPRRIRVSGNNEDNYRVYRALAAYQAGALEFGTYANNTEKFLGEFEHKDLAKAVLEVCELARVGSLLRKKYAGLRKDLDSCDKVLLKNVKDGEAQAQRLVREMRCAVYGAKCNDTLADIVGRAKAGLGVESSFDLAREAYNVIAPFWTDGAQGEIDADSVLSINSSMKASVGGGVDFLTAGPKSKEGESLRFLYDEWNGKEYVKQHVQVFEVALPARKSDYAQKFLEKNAEVVERLKRHFEMFKPQECQVRKRQLSGEVDIDRWVEAKAEIRAGITPSEKIFTRKYKDGRSVAALVAAELSGSLRNFIDLRKPDKRLIDVIRDTQLYVSEALNALGDSFCLCGVSGETEKRVEFYTMKEFDAAYDVSVRERIGALMPMKQNRDGAGIRHATAKLRSRPERVKLLFYLMEGVPHDFGYENERAIEDTKKACLEARQYGCLPIVICYGKPQESLREVANVAVYREIQDAKLLPEVLPKLYEQLTV